MGEITVSWPAEQNEHGWQMLWFGSWLVGDNGEEGDWFYSGRGGEHTRTAVPDGATGLRIRRWPNEGLEAEYADIAPLAGVRDVAAGTLEFDRRQRFSRLVEYPERGGSPYITTIPDYAARRTP